MSLQTYRETVTTDQKVCGSNPLGRASFENLIARMLFGGGNTVRSNQRVPIMLAM